MAGCIYCSTHARSRRHLTAASVRLVGLCGAASIASVAAAQPASLSLANRAYAHAPASSAFELQQFSVSTWLRPTGPGENGGGTLLSCGEVPGSAGSMLCAWWTGWQSSNGHVLGLVVHQYATQGTFVTSNATVPLGGSAHVVFTFDGTTLRLYINGALDRETPFTYSGVDYITTPKVYIGAFEDSGTYTFNRFQGQLDESAIWNRPLNASEAAALAACTPPTSVAGLVAYYPFTDSSLVDVSGHGHHAAAAGGVAFGPDMVNGPCCDSIDFNNDGLFPDTQDIDDFLNVFSGGTCSNDPTCGDIDFNNDGLFPDTLDIDALLSVFSGGLCV